MLYLCDTFLHLQFFTIAAILINAIFAIPFLKSLIPLQPTPVTTTISIGCGNGNFSSQNFGGDAPNVALWTDQLDRIGNPVKGKGSIGQVPFKDIKLDHYKSMGSAESQYLAVSAGGNNAICINYIAITWPDGDSVFLFGDTGHACDRDWYYSRATVGDQSTAYMPACMWIDGDHSGGLHYQGFSFHIPDFPQSQARSQEYQTRPDLMCGATSSNARFGSWGKLGENDWPPMFAPELPEIQGDQVDPPSTYAQILEKGVQVGPGPYGIGNGESSRRRSEERRSRNRRRSEGRVSTRAAATNNNTTTTTTIDTSPSDFIATLVSSEHDADSARGLCDSGSSMGPDYVSTTESLFCDMAAKEVWPLCSNEVTHGFFDFVSQTMLAPLKQGRRDVVTGRTIPIKSYARHQHWSTAY